MKKTLILLLLAIQTAGVTYAQKATVSFKVGFERPGKSETVDLVLSIQNEQSFAVRMKEYKNGTIYRTSRNIVDIKNKNVVEVRTRNNETTARQYTIKENVLEQYKTKSVTQKIDLQRVVETDEFRKIGKFHCRKYMVDNTSVWLTKDIKRIPASQLPEILGLAVSNGRKSAPDKMPAELAYVLQKGFPVLIHFEDSRQRTKITLELTDYKRKVDKSIFDLAGIDVAVIEDKEFPPVDLNDESITEIPLDIEEKVQEEEIFIFVEQMPEFPGGKGAMSQYIEENLVYPKELKEAKTQGRVIVTFVVNEDGSIGQASVIKKAHPQFDSEAIRVIQSMPKWKPGKQRERPVKVKVTIPITFKLDQ